jgi:hypothetical protein
LAHRVGFPDAATNHDVDAGLSDRRAWGAAGGSERSDVEASGLQSTPSSEDAGGIGGGGGAEDAIGSDAEASGPRPYTVARGAAAVAPGRGKVGRSVLSRGHRRDWRAGVAAEGASGSGRRGLGHPIRRAGGGGGTGDRGTRTCDRQGGADGRRRRDRVGRRGRGAHVLRRLAWAAAGARRD